LAGPPYRSLFRLRLDNGDMLVGRRMKNHVYIVFLHYPVQPFTLPHGAQNGREGYPGKHCLIAQLFIDLIKILLATIENHEALRG